MTIINRDGHSSVRSQQGFNLIELMAVMAIISVITIIAIPTYLTFSVRTQVAEGINLIKPFRYAINDYYIQNASWPVDNLAAGMNPAEEYATLNIESITVTQNDTNASIIIDYSIPALGDEDTLIFYTTLDNGRIRWHCDFGTVDSKFRPRACRH